MASPSDWSFPLDFLIDPLVEVLKKTRRWSLDGATLRLLNRHWRVQINRHVTEVHPHESRRMDGRCVSALQQFPNLTLLNARMFVLDAPHHQIREFVDGIQQLPSLSRVEISKSALAKLSGDELVELSRFSCVLSPSVCRWQSDLDTLQKLDVHSLIFRGDDKFLHRTLKMLPSLKHLAAAIVLSEPVKDDLMQSLNALETLKLTLNLRGGQESSSFLSNVTSLVSLKLFTRQQCDLDVLAKLRFLRSLEMPVAKADLSSFAFGIVVQRLTCLSLLAEDATDRVELVAFAQEPTNLQALSLIHIPLKDPAAMNDLSRLTSLCLFQFASPTGMGFLKYCRSLKRLCLIDIRAPDWQPDQVPLICNVLPDLRDLTIEVDGIWSLQDWLRAVGRLPKLEVLGLICDGYARISSKELSLLNRLQNLRVLKIKYVDESVVTDVRTNLELWSRLESLTLAEGDEEFNESLICALRALVPRLKINPRQRGQFWFIRSFQSDSPEYLYPPWR